jgi:hypothetical protein
MDLDTECKMGEDLIPKFLRTPIAQISMKIEPVEDEENGRITITTPIQTITVFPQGYRPVKEEVLPPPKPKKGAAAAVTKPASTALS